MDRPDPTVVGAIRQQGYAVVPGAVPAALCERLVTAMEHDAGVPVARPADWDTYAGQVKDSVPMWGHQAQWDIRQLPSLHALWAELWGTERLWVTLDDCRFTPPWRPGRPDGIPLHWDRDPHAAGAVAYQGVVALTDTPAGHGGFRCVPTMFADRGRWPSPAETADASRWPVSAPSEEIVEVPARAGDLIVWDSHLPHSNSRNCSERPRLAFYLHMHPEGGEEERQLRVDLWQTGTCHPAWRGRPGHDRREPWPPATLSALGRRLLGVERWPEEPVDARP